MNIQTKFNVGDHVFFMKHNSIQQDRISGINIFSNSEPDSINNKLSVEVEYIFDIGYSKISFPYERKAQGHFIMGYDYVFATKEELLKSL